MLGWWEFEELKSNSHFERSDRWWEFEELKSNSHFERSDRKVKYEQLARCLESVLERLYNIVVIFCF
jgi:hypothetical protein